MRFTPAKWVIPAVLTVLLGTAGTIQATKAGMESDLSARAQTALKIAGLSAQVNFDARDAVLSGITTDENNQVRATEIVAGLHGVRSVTQSMSMAPKASPYPFIARIENGKIHLEGGVPDTAMRRSLIEKTGATDDNLELLSGFPDRARWLAATDFALRQLDRLDTGEVRLSDLEFSADGRAKSHNAYESMAIILKVGLPQSVERGEINITPPLQMPYEWQATYDGKNIALSGYVPSNSAIEQLGGDIPAGADMVPDVLLASGEPENFISTATTLLNAFAHVEKGEARIIGASISFSGVPRDEASVDTLLNALNPTGAKVDLAPPRIANYNFMATNAGSKIMLSGYVPDDETRVQLASNSAVDASGLALGRGAPESFDAALEFGMSALALLDAGKFNLNNNAIVLDGKPKDASSYKALQQLIHDKAPQGMTLKLAQMEPMAANPYVWEVERNEEGEYAFSGYVPAPQLRRFLHVRAKNIASDTSEVASGAPDNFINSTLAALAALAAADEGRVSYTGAQWTLVARIKSTEQRLAVMDALAVIDFDAWDISIEGVPAAPMLEKDAVKIKEDKKPDTPSEKRYRFSGKKQPDGEIALVGVVPAKATRRYFGVIAGKVPTTSVYIYDGAPEGFLDAAIAGLRALITLEDGQLLHEFGQWSLSGTARTPALADSITANIAVLDNATDWKTDIALVPPIVVCRENIKALAADNAILFNAGSGRLAESSTTPVDQLAGFLKQCPDAIIHVEGHTDSDGPDNLNLALSVARAEAVVEGLIARGVGAGRLYAIGYGESQPIASNDTRDGKRQNRRIAFKILTEHQ